MNIPSFPKIFAIGTNYILDIFNDPVQVTEKIDGSQFGFGKINGQLYMRSKGAQLFADNPEKMFAEAIDYVVSIEHLIPDNMAFYAEYLKKPKHNTLKYDRIPDNHLMLFGVMDATQKFYADSKPYAEMLGIDHVPVIYEGKINSPDELTAMIDKESVLGGAKMEGVVVKNFHKPFMLGGQPLPLMSGKFVSESFKEVHRERWGAEEKSKSRMEVFFSSFRTEARWEKAAQHLAEKGELENDPRDIGKLFKEVHQDIEAEEMDAIKDFLWKEYGNELKRKATAGMPEWYKQRLLNNAFDGAA